MTAPDPTSLVDLAVRLAREAGELVETMRDGAGATAVTKSSVTDVVTVADKASEQLIVEGILQARPKDGILGEEGGDVVSTSGVRWLIDPIDGTTNYVYDVPAYSVSIAAEYTDPAAESGAIVAGVVYDPKADRLYQATLGGGAAVNGLPITVNHHTDLGTALVATGFGYSSERRAGQAEVLLDLLPRIRDIRRFGSAALDLCAIAEGRVDAYFERGLNPWDFAAGWLIATEAGATVADLRGGPPSEEYLLAAGSDLFAQLRDHLVRLGADRHP